MKITFPHMGNVWIPVKALFDYLDIEFVLPPQNSKRTLSLGTQHSPEGACLPFKLNIGNLIDAAAQGADTVLMTGGVGPCRFGYYGELERDILTDLGINLKLITLEPPDGSLVGLARRIKMAAEGKPWRKIIGAIKFAYGKALAMDRIEDIIHWARPRALNPRLVEEIYGRAQTDLDKARDAREIDRVVRDTRAQVRGLAHKEGFEPLRVGIVGEIYTLLDPFSCHDIERHLGNLGVQLDRSIYISGWINQHIFQGLYKAYKEISHHRELAKPFLGHTVGGHGQETIGGAVDFARRGFDGVIHLLPLTCMPEIVAASILPQVSKSLQIPVMTLYVDEQSGETGLLTRLEAFIDLIDREKSMDRRVRNEQLVLGG